MTTLLPCGGCSACERCEALLMLCACMSTASDGGRRQLAMGREDDPAPLPELYATLRDPARAAELLRGMLEARGAHAAGWHDDVAYPDAIVGARGDEPRVVFVLIVCAYFERALSVEGVAALIRALLAIPPGEQREAALRAVEAAR